MEQTVAGSRQRGKRLCCFVLSPTFSLSVAARLATLLGQCRYEQVEERRTSGNVPAKLNNPRWKELWKDARSLQSQEMYLQLQKRKRDIHCT